MRVFAEYIQQSEVFEIPVKKPKSFNLVPRVILKTSFWPFSESEKVR